MKKCVFVTFMFFAFATFGCGVKGDPLPPERPPELGSGEPTHKRAFRDRPPRGAQTYLDEDPYGDNGYEDDDEE